MVRILIGMGVSFWLALLLFQVAPSGESRGVAMWAGSEVNQKKNSRPAVKITNPKAYSEHPANALVAYTISVTDTEDGESRYGEIAADKILLKIEFIDTAATERRSYRNVSDGLAAIVGSDCFSCHQFNSPSFGPSFAGISNRYGTSQASKQRLANSIIKGSQHIWGPAIMPAHPDISEAVAEKIAAWIIQTNGVGNVNYLTGMQGAFRILMPEGIQSGKFLLTATYTDRGIDGFPGQELTGCDSIIIVCK